MCSQTTETVEAIVSQLIEKQRQSRQAALVKQLSSDSCPDSTCLLGKPCLHRGNVKGNNEVLKRSDSVGQVSNGFSLESKVNLNLICQLTLALANESFLTSNHIIVGTQSDK